MADHILRRMLVVLAAIFLALPDGLPAAAQSPAPPAAVADDYSEKIKPIFESRCIACHSCYNAPCQLNLQSYSGAARGATSTNVYDAQRLSSVPPTRVDIDASTPAAWRQKGFYDTTGAGDPASSLLLRLTRLRHDHAAPQPAKQVADSQVCVADAKDPRIDDTENQAALGMPYGLPALATAELDALRAWVEKGAPGPLASNLPNRDGLPPGVREQVAAWERFLNDPAPRQPLVSRYLYEHLFLASLHFRDTSGQAEGPATRPPFFRLVRSRTACDSGIDEIATRRPTDPPGTASMSYCLRPVTGAIVEKTHIPYELSPQKLERITSLFLSDEWSITRTSGYAQDQANNPFTTFDAIPVKSRYQFLLDDAQFFVATFIKGPVCNGSEAVNSIQEQFFVFFLKPDADSMVALPAFANAARTRLVLPGAWGSDISVLRDLPFLSRLVEYREQYRRLRADSVRKLRPGGYRLDDIWDGDGSNPNAVLTVFRHNDNAAVVKGAVGDLSKTAFVLDYALFERLVYNLVVNFDVFGNIGHQVLTRVYMDLIRMEAEELFLAFLPPPDRKALRADWYQGGLLTDLKLNLVFPLTDQNVPTAVQFRNKTGRKLELVQRVLFERLPPAARGPDDPINWRLLQPPKSASPASITPAERALRRIASIYALKSSPFPRYFPDVAMLLVHRKDAEPQVFSIIHNVELSNVSWIMGENLRRVPYQDSLTIKEGILGSYPDMFFVVDETQVDDFARMARAITSSDGYDRLVDRYGVKRNSEGFWAVYDEVNAIALKNRPIDRGALDLTRYALQAQ